MTRATEADVERAKAWIARHTQPIWPNHVAETLAELLAAVRAEEREACATICERDRDEEREHIATLPHDYVHPCSYREQTADYLAHMIRARGTR